MENTQDRGVVQGGVVVLRNGANPLKDGTEVIVHPVSKTVGTPMSVVAAIESGPPISPEWVDELEELIAQGRRSPSFVSPFAHDNDDSESV